MPQTYAQLRKLSLDELVQLYDQAGEGVQVLSLTFVRQEIALRDFDEQNARLIRMTRRIEWMTVAITIATIVNLVLFVVRG